MTANTMQLALSWTDQCFFAVLLFSAIVLLRGLRHAHVRSACKQILQRKIAVSAALIMLLFLLIAILDSIRFTAHNMETSVTVLDKIFAPLNSMYEKTYSKPLALQSFSSEALVADAHLKKIFPRLLYPPKYIKTDAQKWQLIKQIIVHETLLALFMTFLLAVVILFCRRTIKVSVNMCCILFTMFIIFICVLCGYELSRYFHVFGTGQIGQDILYYTIKSIRTGLVIGLLTTLFMMPMALFFGIAAGFCGGVIDDIIQYIYTTLSSIPGVLLITASVLSMQTYIANHPAQFVTLAQNADARLLAFCLILGVTSWTSLCRMLRAETLKLREVDFVYAARALGSSSMKIIFKHLMPNVMHIVVITLVLDFSFLILAEAVLSYVGAGVSPMTISWGNMINAARLELARDPFVWWPMMAAFIFMFTLVLASNVFADAVRDAFDPHHTPEVV